MSDDPQAAELTDPDEADVALALMPYRVVIHAANVTADVKTPRLMFDNVTNDEPPTETLIADLIQLADAGETLLASFANEKRRDFTAVVARHLGLRAGVPNGPPATRH